MAVCPECQTELDRLVNWCAYLEERQLRVIDALTAIGGTWRGFSDALGAPDEPLLAPSSDTSTPKRPSDRP